MSKESKREKREMIAANLGMNPEEAKPVDKYDPEVAFQNRQRFKPVQDYKMYIRRNEDNLQPEGFNFDADMFENLISCYATFEMIPVMLRTTISNLDKFCKIVYNMPYKETYVYFNYASKLAMNRIYENLAKCGNNTAQQITAKHLMGYKDDTDLNGSINITFAGLDDSIKKTAKDVKVGFNLDGGVRVNVAKEEKGE